MAKTPLRALRVSEELWRAARARADARGEAVSEVVRRALVEYVRADEPSDLAELADLELDGAETPLLRTRASVLVAQGVLMQRFGLDRDAAAAHLHELSTGSDQSLEETAEQITGSSDLSRYAPTPG